ncbi:heat shock protein Hsp20 [Caballeronia arvi]|uniref:Heat shock protein Hsp20 n=1 Tax=Caballeronia arvi TaxID=1777135 RepID=A0A158L2E3_9BURK|nr:heat shock protein Hsp20 [Caballeronia arvi]
MSDNTQITERDESGVTRQNAADARRRQTLTPAVDIIEDGHWVTLRADLPGVSRDKLEVKVHDGSLTIDAESVVQVSANLQLAYTEVRAPYFSRTFTVSEDFDKSKVEASLKDGVLTLTIPRREEAKPRRIEVSAGRRRGECFAAGASRRNACRTEATPAYREIRFVEVRLQ